MLCTSHHSCDSYTKIQETHDPAILRSRNTIAIDYPRDDFRRNERRLVSRSRYQFPFRVSIRHGRAFPSACRISQGNGNRFEERRCESAVGNTPSACTSPSAIGSSLWCPILADQPLALFFRHPGSSKRALFHCPRNIFTTTRAICPCFLCFFFFFHDRRISIVRRDARSAI